MDHRCQSYLLFTAIHRRLSRVSGCNRSANSNRFEEETGKQIEVLSHYEKPKRLGANEGNLQRVLSHETLKSAVLTESQACSLRTGSGLEQKKYYEAEP
jgi:hypothetical protein